MNTCPCCSETLLRHTRHNKVYWFCTHCWQEMDDPSQVRAEIAPSLVQLSDVLSIAPHRSLISLVKSR